MEVKVDQRRGLGGNVGATGDVASRRLAVRIDAGEPGDQSASKQGEARLSIAGNARIGIRAHKSPLDRRIDRAFDPAELFVINESQRAGLAIVEIELLEREGEQRQRVARAHFAKARTLRDEPADQVRLAWPRLGFYGVVDERMDLDLLREVVPGLGRLAIMGNVGNPLTALELGELQAAARPLGLQLDTLEIRRPQDIASALDAVKGRADALYVCQDLLTRANRLRINTLALAARLPVIHASREFIEAAGLISYGPNFPDLYRRTADYVDKILRGAKPADLPVEQPTKFELVVNLTTAKALGLEIPSSLLARADEVIE